jgi:hypothetical protein
MTIYGLANVKVIDTSKKPIAFGKSVTAYFA